MSNINHKENTKTPMASLEEMCEKYFNQELKVLFTCYLSVYSNCNLTVMSKRRFLEIGVRAVTTVNLTIYQYTYIVKYIIISLEALSETNKNYRTILDTVFYLKYIDPQILRNYVGYIVSNDVFGKNTNEIKEFYYFTKYFSKLKHTYQCYTWNFLSQIEFREFLIMKKFIDIHEDNLFIFKWDYGVKLFQSSQKIKFDYLLQYISYKWEYTFITFVCFRDLIERNNGWEFVKTTIESSNYAKLEKLFECFDTFVSKSYDDDIKSFMYHFTISTFENNPDDTEKYLTILKSLEKLSVYSAEFGDFFYNMGKDYESGIQMVNQCFNYLYDFNENTQSAVLFSLNHINTLLLEKKKKLTLSRKSKLHIQKWLILNWLSKFPKEKKSDFSTSEYMAILKKIKIESRN